MKAEGTPLQGSFLGLNYLWGDAPQLSELAHEVGSADCGMTQIVEILSALFYNRQKSKNSNRRTGS